MTYKSPFLQPSAFNPNPFLDPQLLRNLAPRMQRHLPFMDSPNVSRNEATYLYSVMDIFNRGRAKHSRPSGGLWTLSYDEGQYVYDISENKLPLISTKQIFNRSWLHETIWFLSGSTDVEYLKANNVSIWDNWVKSETARYDEQGKLIGGSIGNGAYGAQWRKWKDIRPVPRTAVANQEIEELHRRGFGTLDMGAASKFYWRNIDQIAEVVKALKTNPDSRRIILSAWNVGLIDECVLPPCHNYVQFLSYPSDRTDGKRELTVHLNMR